MYQHWATYQAARVKRPIPARSLAKIECATGLESRNLNEVKAAARDCRACDLYKHSTQTVFGEGPDHALLMLVGEQPGDYEDISGRPFVGPAGRILDRALEEAGIKREQVYFTNTVKHFKW